MTASTIQLTFTILNFVIFCEMAGKRVWVELHIVFLSLTGIIFVIVKKNNLRKEFFIKQTSKNDKATSSNNNSCSEQIIQRLSSDRTAGVC